MNTTDYFGDWLKAIDRTELIKIINWLNINRNNICPSIENVFKAFRLCPYNKCKVVMIFQDPYPQKINNIPIATGIPIGNNINTSEDKLSPSLKILKEAAINFEIPHNIINFDNSLEEWCKQGILMLNSALTCEYNKAGSHTLIWRPFMTKFINKLSDNRTGLIYLLFGNQAQSLKPFIKNEYNYIFEYNHPAYYARNHQRMPNIIFDDLNKLFFKLYNNKLKFFEEL